MRVERAGGDLNLGHVLAHLDLTGDGTQAVVGELQLPYVLVLLDNLQ